MLAALVDRRSRSVQQAQPREPLCDVASEITELERNFEELLCESEPAQIAEVIARARATGDRVLIARGLCLLSRFEMSCGRYEAAVTAAREGLATFAALLPAQSAPNLAFHAELLRSAANALLPLGRIGEALPLIEEAIDLAERAVVRGAEQPATRRHAASTLVRCLNQKGWALLKAREFDTAIEVFDQTVEVADAHPEADDRHINDLVLAHSNCARVLHERVRRSRDDNRPDAAAADLHWARTLLDAAGKRIAQRLQDASPPVSVLASTTYFLTVGTQLLLTDRAREARAVFADQIEIVATTPRMALRGYVTAVARVGLAQSLLALGFARDALDESERALESLELGEDAAERIAASLVRASALRRLGAHESAFAELERHHAARGRREAAIARDYAVYVTAKLGLQRARTAIEAHRRSAVTLEAMGRIGQEITAIRDVAAIVAVLRRHVQALCDAPAFDVWLLDAARRALVPFNDVQDDGVHVAPLPLDAMDAPAARSVRERREVVVENPTAAESGLSIRSRLAMPFFIGERVLGALCIGSKRPQAYGEAARSIVRALCTYGAIALGNAAAYREVVRVVSALQTTQSALAQRTAEFERLSLTDALTGIANRRHFIERARVEEADARRNDRVLTVAIFDLDHFKRINDMHGHVVGDRVLERIAQLAKDSLRPADFIARIGGEEFGLLLPQAHLCEAWGVAERIRRSLAEAVLDIDGGTACVTASFGIAEFMVGEESFEEAFARADGALYRAKQGGRNRVRYAGDENSTLNAID